MPPFIDIHCHLDFPELLPNIDDIIKNAEKEDVKVILTNGVDKDTNRISLKLAEKYPAVKAALGFYPPDAWHSESGKEFNEKEFEEELKFIKKNKNKVSAIGEVGMDFKNGKDKALQENVFSKLILLANELDKPIIVHSRQAEEDAINLLEKYKAKKVIMHCFNGKKRLIEKARDLKFNFSIPTNVVRAENIQNIIKLVSISQLLAETDSPFLSPFKEKRNQPSFVIESYKKIAEIKQMTLEEVKNNLFMNYQRSFS